MSEANERCAACGGENPAAAAFCNPCGRPLAVRCPACGAEQPGHASFCNACGSAVADRRLQVVRRLRSPLLVNAGN